MGASKFTWTDSGAKTFTTDLHVQAQAPRKNRPVWIAGSLDGTVVEAISVGSGQNEIAVMVMAERDAVGLRDWRDAIRRGISQVFTPDLDAPGTTFTVTAIPPIPEIEMQSEGRQAPLFVLGPIVLRRLDGGALWP